MAGLDATGLTIKRLEDIRADMETGAKAEFGTTVKTGANAVLGHILGIFAVALHLVWELAQALYDAFSPQNAEGRALDNVCALTGVTREPATYTTGTVTLTGTTGTVIDAGKLVKNSTTGDLYVILSTVTIGAGGTVDVAVEAEEAGALSAGVGEVDTMETPVAGWDEVTNATALTTGQDAETDELLRARREQSLQIAGSGADGAIRARLLELDDVTACLVISNRTLATDGYGIPAKAFRAIVWPSTGLDEERIAQTIWEHQPAGIESSGATEYSVTDSQGYSQVVKFQKATAVTVYVKATLTTGARYPADGNDQVEAAIQAVFDGLSIGDDVRELALCGAVAGLAGLEGVSFLIDDVSPPVASGDFGVGIDEVALLGGVSFA